MGSGAISCCRKVEPEPEVSSTDLKSFGSNILYKINDIQINSKSGKMKDNKILFINKIKNIGKILDSDFFDSIPNNIQNYIDENSYNELDKRILNYTTYSLTSLENINFPKPIQFKANNIIYLGEWTKEGIINGKGKMYKPDTQTYIEGEWENGSLKYGRIINNKNVYIGYIEDNQYHGKGKYKDFKGNSYEGFFLYGKKHGQGKYIYSDGCIYEGNYENDEIDGFGEFYWINGSYYKGEFSKGIFNGNGLIKWRNGNIYDGDFKKGFFYGNGIFYWKNQEEYYKGEYINNNKSGKGLYKFKNGDLFIGQWSNNRPSGKGSYETKNKIYSGIWKEGIFIEILDIVSKYQSGEINEKVDFNFITKTENIDISTLEHINVKMMIEIN